MNQAFTPSLASLEFSAKSKRNSLQPPQLAYEYREGDILFLRYCASSLVIGVLLGSTLTVRRALPRRSCNPTNRVIFEEEEL